MSDANPNDTDDSPAALRARFEATLADSQRENAMLRAGVDLDSPLGAMFVRGYNGEQTPEAIRAAFAEISPPATPPPPAEAPVASAPPVQVQTTTLQATPEEAAAILASQSLAHGQPPQAAPDPHPSHAAVSDYYTDLKAGVVTRDAEARAVHRVLGAAAAGDQRVILGGDRAGQ